MSAFDPGFSVERSEREGTTVLALHGELDISTTDELARAASGIAPGTELVIDLTDLEFMDSAGLRALMNLDLRAREEGWTVSLTSPQPAVLRLLKLSGFEDRIPIRPAGD